ncbi:hypothetical protein V2J09_003030 [Rumex salicifolius]
MKDPLLGINGESDNIKKSRGKLLFFSVFGVAAVIIVLVGGKSGLLYVGVALPNHSLTTRHALNDADFIESERGVVAADDSRCSEVGALILRSGGHAVDAAVATALCLGVVNPMSSGIGGGAFMVVLSSSNSKAEAFDMRETAPTAASENMYERNPNAKYVGALSMGVPGEIAGLHQTWSKYGRLPWQTLFEPAIQFARDGFTISAYLGDHIASYSDMIFTDPGLREVFAPKGKLLRTGETCYRKELANTLEAVAEKGPSVFYEGEVGEKLVRDVKEAGGILTMEDLKSYKVRAMDALEVEVMGYKLLGMPPPSSGTLGLSMVLNILDSYGSSNAAEGSLGLHRLIEAMKHMFAIRMNLGDPAFVDINRYITKMTSRSFAKQIRNKIFDNTTFPSEYYLGRWSQLQDNGTSHFCVVDAERNAVSMTTTVNYPFGAGVLSPSTGIILNNEMGDFSTPTELNSDKLPPAPANFIRPGKRPLSSMTPLVILKDNQLAGVVGGSGGLYIISAVIQVFLNHFVLGMEPLASIQSPRVYHKLQPNVVFYENVTVIDGEHIELSNERKAFLKERGHQLTRIGVGAVTQLVVQTLDDSVDLGRKNGRFHNDGSVYHGILTAVSDPRKDGKPAAM